jgi:hypothetical protein
MGRDAADGSPAIRRLCAISLAVDAAFAACRPMAIDTKVQILLRVAELRQMRDEAAKRDATLTVRQLDKMIAKTEKDLRELIERADEAAPAAC